MKSDKRLETERSAPRKKERSLRLGSAQSSSPAKNEKRVAKIARIRKALASGSYSVSASDVAEKLIDRMIDH